MSDLTSGLGVYRAIVRVSAAISKTGIGKTRTNVAQNYKFRGIDDVYNELAPLLPANDLLVLPRVLNRTVIERMSVQNKPLFYVAVEVEFDFVCATDGSQHTVKTFGEAMDSGDKGTNKAMSAAYKYAAVQVFCIPTEGDNDADAGTAEVKPPVNHDPVILASLTSAKTVEELAKSWKLIPVGVRKDYTNIKDEVKSKLATAGKGA